MCHWLVMRSTLYREKALGAEAVIDPRPSIEGFAPCHSEPFTWLAYLVQQERIADILSPANVDK